MSMTTITVDDSTNDALPTDLSDSRTARLPYQGHGQIAVSVEEVSHFQDLMDLIKPRISSMVLVTVALSCFVASAGHPNLWVVFHCLLGTTLVAASSGAFNQILEQKTDAKMRRTFNRPLPSGRMTVQEVAAFGIGTLVGGIAYLSLTLGLAPTVWAAITWIVYVCVYTPMKMRTSWNTTVGAVSGALPILIGASAVQQTLSWQTIAMLCVLFFWQFPHFIAIAWIYRKEYSKAGLVMVTTTDATGQAAGRYSVIGAWLLFAVSFVPLLSPSTLSISLSYAAACAALGVYQLRAANDFRQQLDDAAARRLLKASIIYLPLALGLIAVQTAL